MVKNSMEGNDIQWIRGWKGPNKSSKNSLTLKKQQSIVQIAKPLVFIA
jgi:hypothetical protein